MSKAGCSQYCLSGQVWRCQQTGGTTG